MTAHLATGRACALTIIAALCLLFSSLPAHTAVRRSAAQAARFRSNGRATGRDRQGLARGERRAHAAGEDHLSQPRRQPGHPGVRLPAAEDRAAPKSHPALVWVHEDIRGHLYEHYIPYIREATAKGYVVIAPEYRGSIGYGQELYDAIDYGGAEVDDVVTAVDVLKSRYPDVDPSRIGIIGWSHGGLITLLVDLPQPDDVQGGGGDGAGDQPVPAAGVEGDRPAAAGDRSAEPFRRPAFRKAARSTRSDRRCSSVDRLQIPLLVHVATNDEDVNIEESMPLVDALRARKPQLAETKVYDNPPGGHRVRSPRRLRCGSPRTRPSSATRGGVSGGFWTAISTD